MSLKSLATVAQVQSILKTNSILVEVDGSIRKITLDKLIDSINAGNEQLLRSVAWGVPIKQSVQSSSNWGRIGNLDMWELFKSQCGRYLVKNNGHAAKLSVINSGIYADGTPLDESIGHVLFHAPKLYFRVMEDAVSGIPTLWMSLIPIGGHFIPETNIGAYKASMSGSALASRSGVQPAESKNIIDFWNAAQVNGLEWGLINYNHYRLMVMLLLSEYGSPNVQQVLGNGVTGTNNNTDNITPTTWNLGTTKSLGDSCGKIDFSWENSNGITVQGANHVSLFGIENPYGLMWEYIQGIYCGSSKNANQNGTEIFIYEGNRIPSTDEIANYPMGDYRQISRLPNSFYIQEMLVGEFFDLIPTLGGGGGTSYWGDYFFSSLVGQSVFFGGWANSKDHCGITYLCMNYCWLYTAITIGSRLAYYGELTFMSGRELVAEV